MLSKLIIISQFKIVVFFAGLRLSLFVKGTTIVLTLAPAKIAKKNVRKVAVRKTAIINYN